VLDRGRLRQLGTPRQVYERPADTFVAGFIGSPPMNLFDATLVPEGPGAPLAIGTQRLARPALPDPVRATAGRGPLTLGVRPEAVRLTDAPDAAGLAATTTPVELLGHDSLVHVRAGDVTLTARTDGMRTWPRDARVGVVFDPAALYFFDAAGAAVAAPSRTTT
jgi:ABC-type sugar transport system ATPase subunit